MKRSLLLLLTLIFLLSSAFIVLADVPDAEPLNGWNSSKTVYYENGEEYTGEKKISGKWYLFKNGIMKKGFRTIEYKGKAIRVYYSKKTGEKLFGAQKIKGNWYYFRKKSGAMLTGWRKVNGKKKYYYNPDGTMFTGHIVIKKTMYEFAPDGQLWKKISKSKARKATGKSSRGMKTYSLIGLSDEQIIEKIGPLFTADQKKTGILASVSLAQFMVESWGGRSELALMSNNCFGIMTSASGNNWRGSTWDGHSSYRRTKKKVDSHGNTFIKSGVFRKYACIEDSIADHSAYLCNSHNGSRLRYAGLKGCKDYKKALYIIQNGGYAEDAGYAKMLIKTIKDNNLTRFDL